MKAIGILVLKLGGCGVVYLCWRAIADHSFSFWPAILVTWGGVAGAPVVALCGRGILNRRPTFERAALVTLMVHYLEGLLLGCALIVAFPLMQAHPWVNVPFPRPVSAVLMQILSILALLAVVNLAVRGLGLPFAALLSRKLATSWLYARSRNPMLLACLLFFLATAIWMQSLHAILWVLGWLAPGWILFVRLYEERELEVRFGAPYLEYKARTPFFV